jgi:hypothetical protein
VSAVQDNDTMGDGGSEGEVLLSDEDGEDLSDQVREDAGEVGGDGWSESCGLFVEDEQPRAGEKGYGRGRRSADCRRTGDGPDAGCGRRTAEIRSVVLIVCGGSG